MAKPAIVFVCADCGAETLKWQGQCPQCSQWNTLEQRTVARRPAAPAAAGAPPADLADLATASCRASRRAWASWIASWAAG